MAASEWIWLALAVLGLPLWLWLAVIWCWSMAAVIKAARTGRWGDSK